MRGGKKSSSDKVRDAFCTPMWLCELFPRVDLDPCSNPRSHVDSLARYILELGQNGLKLPWRGSVYVNPPYSDVLPWALRCLEPAVTDAGVLVNVDSSTMWWAALTRLGNLFLFRKRIPFEPPPGIVVDSTSGNDRPQALFATDGFRRGCLAELNAHGTWWRTG